MRCQVRHRQIDHLGEEWRNKPSFAPDLQYLENISKVKIKSRINEDSQNDESAKHRDLSIHSERLAAREWWMSDGERWSEFSSFISSSLLNLSGCSCMEKTSAGKDFSSGFFLSFLVLILHTTMEFVCIAFCGSYWVLPYWADVLISIQSICVHIYVAQPATSTRPQRIYWEPSVKYNSVCLKLSYFQSGSEI